MSHWVSDYLHELAGMSEGSLEKAFVDIAKQATSQSQVMQFIRESELPINQTSEEFATKLHDTFGVKPQVVKTQPILQKRPA